MKEIKEGDWYNDDLSDEQKKRFDEYITTNYDYILSDDVLYEYEETCETLKDLYNATQNEFDWISKIHSCDFEEKDLNTVFNIEEYELYEIGKKAPIRYFIILYMLSVVANLEEIRGEQNENSSKHCWSLEKSALDLINRLQAENERLTNLCHEQNTEIDRLIKTKNRLLYNLKSVCEEKDEETIKAEAYKEFADLVENKIRFLENRGFLIHYVVKDALNNLLKELVGEE